MATKNKKQPSVLVLTRVNPELEKKRKKVFNKKFTWENINESAFK